MRVTDLRVENRVDPLGVDARAPVFSWRAETDERSWYQKGYRLRVRRGGATVWDSGYVESRRMNEVEYGGEPLLSDCRYDWDVEVTSVSGETAGAGAFFETALFRREDWMAGWIKSPAEGFPILRRTFTLAGPVREARLFICGLGHQKTCINRREVTDAVLEAGWTDYRKSCLYCVYDVGELLREGKNAVSVSLGDGMYNVPGGRYAYYPRSYGEKKLLARLRVTYESGGEVNIVTDTSWQAGPGPIKFCCIYGGEDYDGGIPEREPSSPDFEPDGAWEPAAPAPEFPGVLRAASAPPLRVMRRYPPRSIRRLEGGAYLVDLGTNFSGWARIRLRTAGDMAGKRVTLTPGELLTPGGEPDQRVTGPGYAWTYICGGGDAQEFAPDFTYTGFRYVKVEGAVPSPGLWRRAGRGTRGSAEGLPVLEELTGEFIYPDMEEAGGFSCSNALFDQIHRLVRQAMLSNIKSCFTDCPHREKLPWLEETHLIGPAMMCFFDLRALYEKIERDMADSQHGDGLVPDVCPEYVTGFGRWHRGFVDSPEWGSACVINMWHLYRKYGSVRALRDWYPTMKKYVEYLTGRTWHGVLHHGLGDWLDVGPCTPYSQNTPVPVTATCVYYMDLGILEKAAELTGNGADAAAFRAQRELVFEEYNRQFLDTETGRYANGSQTAQAMSLMAGLVPERYREKVLGQLRDEVVKRGYAITAGDVGHPYLTAALMQNGMSDILNKMTNITDTPGYGYQVVNGATTLTEEWDGPDPKRPHGSQNHLMLGSIDEWFCCGLGGIGSIRAPGQFDRVTVCPHIAEGVDECKVWTAHPYGRLSVSWRREGPAAEGASAARVTVTVPPNLTVRLMSEDGSFDETVGSGVWEYRAVSGKKGEEK